jgi:hypothetical protein
MNNMVSRHATSEPGPSRTVYANHHEIRQLVQHLPGVTEALFHEGLPTTFFDIPFACEHLSVEHHSGTALVVVCHRGDEQFGIDTDSGAVVWWLRDRPDVRGFVNTSLRHLVESVAAFEALRPFSLESDSTDPSFDIDDLYARSSAIGESLRQALSTIDPPAVEPGTTFWFETTWDIDNGDYGE